MLKKLMKKEEGFTLAELLIVVAIIAVLTAIAIPVFTTQLEKSREATDQANIRSAYADVMANYLTNADNGYSMTVKARQTQDDWQGPSGTITVQVNGTESEIQYNAHKTGESYEVKITSGGSVTIS